MISGVLTELDNGLFRVASPELEKPRTLSAHEDNALTAKSRELQQWAEARHQETCWSYDCNRKATAYVREVCFDLKGSKAQPVQHTVVSSADYEGSVPAFCPLHVAVSPRDLAEAVYFTRAEIAFGVTPTRWWVVFTDDSKAGGECVEFNLQRGVYGQKP